MMAFIKFVWATIGRKILNDDISAKEEDIELQLTGMVNRQDKKIRGNGFQLVFKVFLD